MFKFSCFADEISPDIDLQIRTMKENDIKYVAFRSIWDKFILQLDDEDLRSAKKAYDDNGIKVSSIGSHIGKVKMDYDFNLHLKELKRVIEVAKYMETPNIRLFAFFMEHSEYEKNEEMVLDRMCQMVRLAEENDVVLLLENETEVFCDTVDNCLKIYNATKSKNLRHCFDPCNAVNAGENPIEAFNRLREYISDFHVKDFSAKNKCTTIAGEGDGKIPEILAELRKVDSLYLTLEPHLIAGNNRKGFTGPEMFTKDYKAVVNILNGFSGEYI